MRTPFAVFSRPLLVLSVCTGLSAVQAAPLPFSKVLTGLGVKHQAVHPDWAGFTFQNRTFQVEFQSHNQDQKLNEMRFYFRDRNISQAEIKKVASLTASIAVKCFNLKAERLLPLRQRLEGWLTNSPGTVHENVGPMLLDLQHTSGGEVLIWFTRTGIPGKSPWINHCTTS